MMKLFRIRNYQEYSTHCARMCVTHAAGEVVEASMVPLWRKSFRVRGYSYPAGRQVDYLADFKYASEGQINWRERLLCPVTGLNNRMRATVHLLETEFAPYQNDAIYISEQVTPFFNFLSGRYSKVTGSEWLGDGFKAGEVNSRGIRNEDLTRLSFEDSSFRWALSLDCLEHIPDYPAALKECCRILQPGGKFLFSAPFDRFSAGNLVRARLQSDGSVLHLLPPELHGNPLDGVGSLCFTTFGWQLLDEVLAAGFSDAYAICYWSLEFGYLGGEQIVFAATR